MAPYLTVHLGESYAGWLLGLPLASQKSASLIEKKKSVQVSQEAQIPADAPRTPDATHTSPRTLLLPPSHVQANMQAASKF